MHQFQTRKQPSSPLHHHVKKSLRQLAIKLALLQSEDKPTLLVNKGKRETVVFGEGTIELKDVAHVFFVRFACDVKEAIAVRLCIILACRKHKKYGATLTAYTRAFTAPIPPYSEIDFVNTLQLAEARYSLWKGRFLR